MKQRGVAVVAKPETIKKVLANLVLKGYLERVEGKKK